MDQVEISWPIALGPDYVLKSSGDQATMAPSMASRSPKNASTNPSETTAATRFLRGPQANARQEDLDDLAAAGRGDTVPSVVGFKAVKKDIRRVGVIDSIDVPNSHWLVD